MTETLMNELLIIKPDATIEDLHYYSRESQLDRELIMTRAINRNRKQQLIIEDSKSKNKYNEVSKKIWR